MPRPLPVLGLMMGLVLGAWLCAAPASADDGAAAQILWDEARAHIKEGDFESACPKFAESHRLDPQLGTLMNVANCYAEIGKVASAWAKFVEASEMAKARKDPREKEAKKRADELEPKLVRMELVVEDPVDGLILRRDDELIAQPLWGSTVPVDPGLAVISAKADGHLPWEKNIDLTKEGSTVKVVVPALEPAPVEDAPGPVGGDAGGDEGASTALLVSGIVVTSLGAVGLGVGTAFMVIAKGKDDDSLAFCEPDDPTLCRQEGVDLRDEAITAQTVGIVGLVTGGVLTATGVSLILSAYLTGDDPDETAVVPWVGPTGAGLTGRWTF